MNVKGAGGGHSVQGHDIVVKENVKGAGGDYQNLEGTRNQGRYRMMVRVVALTMVLLQVQRGITGSSESRHYDYISSSPSP